jgi:hypothetical protein
LVAALSALTCVRRIDTFGSVASGQADEWSDLDLLVACEIVERTAWVAAAAIRSAKRVAFYRTFTGIEQPSGRYWFCDESPFHRLDISFLSSEAHAAICCSGVRFGHPITIKPEHVADLPPDPYTDARLFSPVGRLEITARERHIGRLLYVHLEATKCQRRGRPIKRSITETRAALLDAASSSMSAAGDERLMRFLAKVDEFVESTSCQNPRRGAQT